MPEEVSTRPEEMFAALGIDAVDADSDTVLGRSAAMRGVLRDVQRYARSDLNVAIRGESGVGKEVVARLLHVLSDRTDSPFVAINCAALSESVLESELFGHEKGAFTGAIRCHRGRFERAAGGVLFLDEIGEISLAFQAKLLRVLQEGEFERVGGTDRLRSNARILTATNRDLEEAVRRGQFRLDLYFRLNAATIFVPPLRERPEDVPLLVQRIIHKRTALRERIKNVTPSALSRLVDCRWPGNIRELENCILRAASATHSGVIDVDSLCCGGGRCFSKQFWSLESLDRAAPWQPAAWSARPSEGAQLHDMPSASDRHIDSLRFRPRDEAQSAMTQFIGKVSREALVDALRRSGWIHTRAARLLGLTPRQVGYAVRRYGILPEVA